MSNKDIDESGQFSQETAAGLGNKWQKIAETSTEEAASPVSAHDETADEENAPVAGIDFPSRTELETQLTAMELQVEKYKDQLIRVQAEFENVRRRAERDVSNAHKYGIEKLVQEMLPVTDSLVRALQTAANETAPGLKAMQEGMQLTLDLLYKALAKMGVTPLVPQIGESFNPDIHEAMSMLSAPNAKPNTVLQVLQQGYRFNDRVLRAAMVIVVKE